MWNSLRNTVSGLMDDESTTSPTIRKANRTHQPRQKRADLRASPGKEGQDGRLVNILPINLNKSLNKSSNSITSVQSSLGRKQTEELIKKRDYMRTMAGQRKMKVLTNDMHIHAIAMLIGIDIDFDLFPLPLKTQLLSDIQSIISSITFDPSPLYQRFNLDIILQFLIITESTVAKNKKELIELSKIVVAEITNKALVSIQDITSKTLNGMCNMIGLFIPQNGIPPYYKKLLISDIHKHLESGTGIRNTFVNKHALAHLSFYYGDLLRPIANQSKDNIFYTNGSFSLDSRRGLIVQSHPGFINPGNATNSVFGSSDWCSSGSKCQVDLWPASNKHKCSSCFVHVHPQCAQLLQTALFCQTCKPDLVRRHWNTRRRIYQLLPSIHSHDIDIQHYQPEPEQIWDDRKQAPNLQETFMLIDTSTQEPLLPVNDKDNSVNKEDDRNEDVLTDTNNHDTLALSLLRSQLRMDVSHEPPSTRYDDDELEFNTRWDLVFTLPSTREATDELTLINMFTGFINALKMTDVTAAVVPWYNSSLAGQIDIINLQPDIDAIQIYFPRARVNPDNVKVYTDVRIAHTVSRNSLEIGIRNWLINSKSSLYYKHLQVENTRVVGWFMWSHRYIKSDRLAHILAEEHNIHGFFRFSTIYLGKGEKFGPKEGTKALFLVCESKDFIDVTAELRVLYHQGQTKFPLGIRLRFMPQIQNIDENLLLKMQIFRVQQYDFSEHIKTAGTSDIHLLDASIQGEKTLRNFIMNIKHHGTKDPLFLSVDTPWNDPSRCVFAFVASHEIVAIRTVNTLAAMVLKKNPERASYCFTPKALETASTYHWDTIRKCYMTPEETYYLEMDLWGNDTALMGVEKNSVELTISNDIKAKANILDKSESPASRIERLYNGNEACSVGTVASKYHNKRITGDIDIDTDAASTTGDSFSTQATTKSQRKSQQSKLLVMEANVMRTQRAVVDMAAMLDDIKSRLSGNVSTTPSEANRHITIHDSSADSKLATNTGFRQKSGVQK